MFKLIAKIPIGILSVFLTIVVLYLCLAPQPIDEPPSFMLFEGADKVVHALMFFALSVAYLFDYWKAAYPHRPRWGKLIAIVVAAIMLGGIIEVLQQVMGLGRSMDGKDLLADTVGVAIGFLLMYFYAFNQLRKARSVKDSNQSQL